MSTISLRIHVRQWQDRGLFEQLLAMLREYRRPVSEVAFFTGYTHPPLPLETIRAEAEQLRLESIPAMRELGLRVGINHLSTLGHVDENPEDSLNEPWQHLVDISGAESPSCYCAEDPRVREYIRECYAALASAAPEFIWVDDDVRLEHHPQAVRYACFCPFCLDVFARESGRLWTRGSLHEAFNSGPREERLAVRRAWLDHNSRYIVRLLDQIRQAVDGVDPGIRIGLMTGETGYSSYDYAARTEAMAGPRGIEVMWRPGGGFYSDDLPLGALGKAHSIGRQAACVPESVTDVQYEHENFPYQPMRKSRALFAGEIVAAIGAGCTGTALNILSMFDSSWECAPYLDKAREVESFLTTAADTLGRSPCEGIGVPFTSKRFASLCLDDSWENAGSWGAEFTRYYELAEIGLPFAYSERGTAIALLTPENCDECSADELRRMLASGVLIDGPALERLHEIGLGDLTGFRVCGRKDADSLERLTAHGLNGDFAGFHRDCRPSFYPEPVYLLEPMSPAAEPISEIIDFSDVVHGIGAGVYENELGGRVAVFGYFPWRMIQTTAKTVQLKRVCRWLSRDRLPAYVASYHKAAIWNRRDSEGRPVSLLLNASADTAEGIEVAFAGDASSMEALYMDGRTETLSPVSTDGGYSVYRLGRVDPWHGVLLRPM